ncbi:hypothetical protein Poly30_44310 [Planctomycetes bacterium Poly30]|uniref:Uncharacterized protein n=1 Tax=Saltatorellus ferox TaxID=2528018 RepID=A0A518EXQ0_9BACT|nr:hypothetical protein Poly30_44310 [Planctomycetes bacterium Poly30]
MDRPAAHRGASPRRGLGPKSGTRRWPEVKDGESGASCSSSTRHRLPIDDRKRSPVGELSFHGRSVDPKRRRPFVSNLDGGIRRTRIEVVDSNDNELPPATIQLNHGGECRAALSVGLFVPSLTARVASSERCEPQSLWTARPACAASGASEPAGPTDRASKRDACMRATAAWGMLAPASPLPRTMRRFATPLGSPIRSACTGPRTSWRAGCREARGHGRHGCCNAPCASAGGWSRSESFGAPQRLGPRSCRRWLRFAIRTSQSMTCGGYGTGVNAADRL